MNEFQLRIKKKMTNPLSTRNNCRILQSGTNECFEFEFFFSLFVLLPNKVSIQ